ncbi:MAG: AAA family ATPase [Sandaracinaceae bacterium]|nr:AAA family ATPase [Sandaracinaceae bacterium]
MALVVFDERAHGAGGGAATEVAVRAARCARALCELDASLVVAMGAGLARHEARGPVGSAVDRAASLLSDVAGERGVLLDSASARLLEARFEVTSRGAACVLGSERADVGFRRFLGRTSRFVGRRRELAFLSAAYEECCEERVGQAVLLVGEPGVGKSRLAHELEQRVEGATWLGARCDPVYADSAFALISRLITSALGAERLEPASLRAALGGRLDVEQSERAAVALGELLGVSAEGREVAAMGQHRRAVLALFETVAIDEPLVMMIEDVHWADPTSVELVQEIVAARRDRPTMLVATARPSVDVRFPRLWEGVALRRLAVEPLDDHAASRLAREVLGGRSTRPRWRASSVRPGATRSSSRS